MAKVGRLIDGQIQCSYLLPDKCRKDDILGRGDKIKLLGSGNRSIDLHGVIHLNFAISKR